MSSPSRTGRPSRLHNLLHDLGFQPYNQFVDSAPPIAAPSGLSSTLPNNEYELSSPDSWHRGAEQTGSTTPDYHPEGILESLQNTLSSLDSQSVAAEQPAPPGIAPASSASSVDTDSHVDQADLLGLHDAEQSSAPQRVPAQVDCGAAGATQLPDGGHQADTLYAELGTLDKQHLSITLLLYDNDQLQARLAEAERQMQQMRISEAAAQEAWKASEFQLTQSQDVARQARAAQSQAKARALAAADAAAQAEARLAGQATTGRNFMERIAQLKFQLHSLQQLVHEQDLRPAPVRAKRVQTQTQGTQTHSPHVANTATEADSDLRRELEQLQHTLTCTVAESKHREQVAQEHIEQLQQIHNGSDSLMQQLAEAQHAQHETSTKLQKTQHAQHDLKATLQEAEQSRQAACSQADATQQLLSSCQEELHRAQHESVHAQADLQASSALVQELRDILASSQVEATMAQQQLANVQQDAVLQQQQLQQQHDSHLATMQKQHGKAIAELQDRLTQHGVESQVTQQRQAQLEAQLAEQTQTAAKSAQAAATQHQAQQLKLGQLQEAYNQEHAVHAEAQQAVSASAAGVQVLKQELEHVKQQAATAAAEFEAKQQAQADEDTKKSNSSLEQAHSSLLAVTEQHDRLEQQVKALQVDQERSEQHSTQLQDKVTAITEQNTVLWQEHLAELAGVNDQLAGSQGKVHTLEQQLQLAEEKLRHVAASHASNEQQHQAEVSQMQLDLNTAQARVAEVEQNLAAATTSHERETQQRDAERSSRLAQIKNLEAQAAQIEHNAAQQQLRDAELADRSLQAFQDLEDQHQSLLKKATEQEQDGVKLQADLAASKAEQLSTEGKLLASQAELAAVMQQRDEHKGSGLKLKSQLQQAQSGSVIAQQTLLESQQQVSQLRGQLEQSIAVEQALRQQLHQAEAAAAQAQHQLEARNAELDLQLQSVQQAKACCEQELVQIQTAHATAQQQLEQTKASNFKLEQQLQVRMDETSQLQQQVEQLQIGSAQRQGQLQASSSKTNHLQQQLQVSHSEADQLKQHVQAAKHEAEQLQQQLLQAAARESGIEQLLQASEQSVSWLQNQVESLNNNTAALQDQLMKAQAAQTQLQEEVRVLQESPQQAQQAERQFKEQLAALPTLKAKHEVDNPFGLHHLITDEPDAGLNTMLASEVTRLRSEMKMLSQKLQDYEADMDKLISVSKLGHDNPNQKIQYARSLKTELEDVRKQCTRLLRDRFMLEQGIRYLAVRLGLNVAVVKDVFGQRERQAVDKLQPQILARSGAEARLSLADIRPQDLDLFDMELTSRSGPGSVSSRSRASDVFYSPRMRSPGSSMGESVRSFQAGSPEELEALILSRINAICQPGVYARARQAQVSSNKADLRPMAARGPSTPDRHLSFK